MDLLTVCENGYGKRTPFGVVEPLVIGDAEIADEPVADDAVADEPVADEPDAAGDEPEAEGDESDSSKSNLSYRRQRRGGKGIRAIKTSDRNGQVVDILAVHDDDEVLMVTAGGIIQRIRVRDVSVIGRNTQGVRIIRLDEGDKLVSLARVPGDEIEAEDLPPENPASPDTPDAPPEG
jgi:DNA gyrase subunit A